MPLAIPKANFALLDYQLTFLCNTVSTENLFVGGISTQAIAEQTVLRIFDLTPYRKFQYTPKQHLKPFMPILFVL
jgi:hypothetical protein